jgi:hypothetical protein
MSASTYANINPYRICMSSDEAGRMLTAFFLSLLIIVTIITYLMNYTVNSYFNLKPLMVKDVLFTTIVIYTIYNFIIYILTLDGFAISGLGAIIIAIIFMIYSQNYRKTQI